MGNSAYSVILGDAVIAGYMIVVLTAKLTEKNLYKHQHRNCGIIKTCLIHLIYSYIVLFYHHCDNSKCFRMSDIHPFIHTQTLAEATVLCVCLTRIYPVSHSIRGKLWVQYLAQYVL